MVQLTPEQVASYHKDGYLLLRADEHGLVDAKDLTNWTNEIAAWPNVRGKWMPYNEVNTAGESQLLRTEKFADYHEGYKALLFGPDLAGILGQLSGETMLLFKDKINYKLPHGNGFHPHLDAPAYDHISRTEHVTANIAIDAATPANGCLEVVPGSHKMKVDLAEGGRIADSWVTSHEWASIPLNRGDILIFGSHLAHRSEPNETEFRRASLYATFHGLSDGTSLREEYYAHRRKAFPPDHERDPAVDYSAGYKTYGFAAPFTQVTAPIQAQAAVRV